MWPDNYDLFILCISKANISETIEAVSVMAEYPQDGG